MIAIPSAGHSKYKQISEKNQRKNVNKLGVKPQLSAWHGITSPKPMLTAAFPNWWFDTFSYTLFLFFLPAKDTESNYLITQGFLLVCRFVQSISE